MEGIVMVLGSPNDDQGNLSDIAIGRAEKGIEVYGQQIGLKFLCTGGFGAHFNITATPHAEYLKKYLIKQGVKSEDVLSDPVLSHDTLEDAVLSKPVVARYKPERLIIVSSDFHMERVRYIFERIFQGYALAFIAALTNFSAERYEILNSHEKRELRKLKQGGILPTARQ